MGIFAAIGFIWTYWGKYGTAVTSLVQAIEQHVEEAKQQEFADSFTKGWTDGLQTGDATNLHAVIDSHPAFKLRK